MDAILLENEPSPDEGAIHMLDIDTLLVIFNCLSLYYKLTAMRVSKKWHHIIKNHAWSVIDFREKGPTKKLPVGSRGRYRRLVSKTGPNIFKYEECCNEWIFPINDTDQLKFLGLYASVGLQEVHLTALSDDIMSYLRGNCPNIHTLSIRLDFDDEFDFDDEILNFPPKLQRLEMKNTQGYWQSDELKRFERFIPWIDRCPHLRKIALHEFNLSLPWMKKLSEITGLREIDVFGEFYEHETADEDLSSTIGSLTTLTCLKLSIRCLKEPPVYIDNLLRSIAYWTNLKALTLRGVLFTDEAFDGALPGILNLETLELAGKSVTSLVVNHIGIHLRKLKSLTLTSHITCYYWVKPDDPLPRYSCESLQALSYHPNLEYFEVHQPNNTEEKVERERWVRQVYDVLVTLPWIRKVKMLGFEILFCFRQETYPVINDAEIEVDDQKKYCNKIDIDIESKWRVGRNIFSKIFNRFFKTDP
ncbi:uncharacterized protein [Amphiura filiformis]|uniref:uncharacterized protein n=1 Tax=Amphiura filiformis TaxID=82378 RepID=UPI003B225D9A